MSVNTVNEPLINGTQVLVDELVELKKQAPKLNLKIANLAFANAGLPISKQGHGLSHLESRVFVPGDQARHIDWGVTARTGKVHVKLFEQEQDQLIFMMIDLNPSMQFGTKRMFKSVQAARSAAVTAWSGAKNSDCRIGGLVVNGDSLSTIESATGDVGALNLIKAMVAIDTKVTAQSSWFENAMTKLCGDAAIGASVMIFSDFNALTAQSYELLGLMAQRYHLTLVFIYDPLEQHLPANKSFQVTSGHNSYWLNGCDHNFRDKYHQQFRQHQQRLEQRCADLGINFVSLATNQPALGLIDES